MRYKTDSTRSKSSAVVLSSSWLTEYALLFKLKLTSIVVLTSLMAFVIASAGVFDMLSLIMLGLGGFSVTAAANTLNQVLERDYDKLMVRTHNRPLAAGRMTVSSAVLTAGLFSLFGITLLSFFNPITGLMGMMSLILYAFVYTPLKRHSSIAVIVGAIPGALPALIGCVAFDGYISQLALILFSIQFLWQLPHFWSIAQLSLEDYTVAGYNFIPVENGQLSIGMRYQAFGAAILLCLISLTSPFFLDFSWPLAIVALVLSGTYTYLTYQFLQNTSRPTSLKLMFSSFAYMPLIMIVFIINYSVL